MQILSTIDAVITDLEKRGITRYSKALHGVFTRLAMDVDSDGNSIWDERDEDSYDEHPDDRNNRQDRLLDRAHQVVEKLLYKLAPHVKAYYAMPPGPEQEELGEKIYGLGDNELQNYEGEFNDIYGFPDSDGLLSPLFATKGDPGQAFGQISMEYGG